MDATRRSIVCGIAGFWSRSIDRADRESATNRMQNAMIHRGPDHGGHVSSGALSMGMRRLAIFDPANGNQPMSTSDGRFHLVFNGAIYNHREIRNELERAGVNFSTHCDTEVLLQAWAQWGVKSLSRFRGMFAFAIWDFFKETLTLVRDQFGIKPLYFSQKSGNLLFASELNAMKASGQFDSEIDPHSIDNFLRNLSVAAPNTVYRHAQTLRPAEMAVWKNQRLEISRYWQLPTTKDHAIQSSSDFTTELRRQLDDSIAHHQLADVPVGAFLSGGLDSTAIVGLMSQHTSTPLKTFSIGFEESAFSEAAAAAETAQHFGTDHHEITLTGSDAAQRIPSFIESLDQPTGDGFNTFIVSQAAREGGVTAALSGLGGDELFGGYPQFKQSPQVARWLPWWLKIPAALRSSVCGRLAKGSTRAKRLADVLTHSRDLHDVADRQRQVLSDEFRQKLLSFPLEPSIHPTQMELRAMTGGASAEEIISAWEMRTYMSDVLLRDSDVFSMKASLELRVPFVDRLLVDWLWRQKSSLRFHANSPKGALVDAVKEILPPSLLTRKKRGFSFPFSVWMRGPIKPFLDETFAASNLKKLTLLNGAEVSNYWTKFLVSNDDKDWSRVWSLAILVSFLNRSN